MTRQRPIYGTDYLDSDSLETQTSAFQAALDEASSSESKLLLLGPGTFITGTIIIPDGVTIVGSGKGATVIKLADGTDDDLIRSEGFSTLTGTDSWSTLTEGVPSRFSIRSLTLHGNRDNNSTGWPLRVYGKLYTLDDIEVREGASGGIYSEADYSGGSVSDGEMCETVFGPVWISDCSGNGVTFRGSHDAHIRELWVGECTGDGLSLETSTNVYNGSVDIGLAHLYACTRGLYSTAEFRCDTLIVESNNHEGAVITGNRTLIGSLLAYRNWRSYSWTTGQAAITDRHIDISNTVQIGSAYIETQWGGTALYVSGSYPVICQNLRIDGKSKIGIGVDTTVNATRLAGWVQGFTGAGGIGVRVNSTAARDLTWLDFTISNCKTGFVDSNGGNRNHWNINVYADTGQTPYSLSGTTSVTGTQNTVSVICGGPGASGVSDVVDLGPVVSNILTPAIDGTINVGSPTKRFQHVHGVSFRVNDTSGLSTALYQFDSAGLRAGPGAGAALDVPSIHRGGENLWETNSVFRPDVLRLQVLDHDPPVNGDSPSGTLQAGDVFVGYDGVNYKLHVRFSGTTKSVTLT